MGVGSPSGESGDTGHLQILLTEPLVSSPDSPV